MSRKTLNISNNRKHKKQSKTKSRRKSKTIRKRVRLMFGGREYRSPTKTTKRGLNKNVQQGIIKYGYDIYKRRRDNPYLRKQPDIIIKGIITHFNNLVNDLSRNNYARETYEQYELEEIKKFFITRKGYNVQDIIDVLENKYQEDKENSLRERNRELEIIEANKNLLSRMSTMDDETRSQTIRILRNNIDPRHPLNPLNYDSRRSYI
jgi:hypothetical protein